MWHPRYPFTVFAPVNWFSAADPIAHLCRIPLPEQFKSFVEPDLEDRASLYHILTGFVGSPPPSLSSMI